MNHPQIIKLLGKAVLLRQADDLSGKALLTVSARRWVNSVIHLDLDKSNDICKVMANLNAHLFHAAKIIDKEGRDIDTNILSEQLRISLLGKVTFLRIMDDKSNYRLLSTTVRQWINNLIHVYSPDCDLVKASSTASRLLNALTKGK